MVANDEKEVELEPGQVQAIIDQLDPVSVCILHHYAESERATGFALDAEEVSAIKRALERLSGTDELRRCAIGLLYLAQAFEENQSPEAAKALYSLMSWPPIMEAIGDLWRQGLDPTLERAASKVVGSDSLSQVRTLSQLDRLSPPFRETVLRFLEGVEGESTLVPKADLVKLQKLLPGHKRLSTLKRALFDRVLARRDGSDYSMALRDGDEICRLPMSEFARILEVR
ncbi:MAG: hypothetical protein IPK13_19760 [Deltaproteobacteria bacterium]|nr:hypothetical protein [Deltaproteobacteria bacterium]